MEPTLLVGDRIFVSKYAYGYSKHSFPFSPNVSSKRFFSKVPKRGDLVVFKTPADNRTDYIKRLIGLPGDTIQFKNGELFINDKNIPRTKIRNKRIIRCGNFFLETNFFIETLPNGVNHLVTYKKKVLCKIQKNLKFHQIIFFCLATIVIVQKTADILIV